jgi:C-terminal processing protease CtpA/Prc
MVTVAPASHAINPWVPLLLNVKEMPKKGNATSYLCSEMRAVLNQADRMVFEYSREKTKLLADSIFDKGLEMQTKIDEMKTTLGIVFTDDMVATVLPGGPAFVAGLRKGDRILKVRNAPTRCNLQPCVFRDVLLQLLF